MSPNLRNMGRGRSREKANDSEQQGAKCQANQIYDELVWGQKLWRGADCLRFRTEGKRTPYMLSRCTSSQRQFSNLSLGLAQMQRHRPPNSHK